MRQAPKASSIAGLLLTATQANAAEAGPLSALLGGSASGSALNLVLLLTALSLLPAILMTMTAFVRIAVVLSLLRTGLGAPGAPPNVVVIALALFLTLFVMQPTVDVAWDAGIKPYIAGRISEDAAFQATTAPFHKFMLAHVRENDLAVFIELSGTRPASAASTPLRTLVPAFLISELRRAFEIGFLLLLPFVIIDLVVAAVLMALGLMMLPPATVSLPAKLVFFVLVDGWTLVASSLVKSFAGG